MSYFLVKHKYEKSQGGAHLIKAKNKADAIRIAMKYGITMPWGRTDIIHSYAHKLYTSDPNTKWLLKRRVQGLGGSIWFEENGELKKLITKSRKDAITKKEKTNFMFSW